MNGIVNFIKDAYYELTEQMTWPKWNDLQSATVVVVVSTVILALFLFAVDKVFSESLKGLFALLNGIF